MAQTEGKGGGRIEEAQGKTGQAQGDQGWTRKEIKSTKEGKKIVKLQIKIPHLYELNWPVLLAYSFFSRSQPAFFFSKLDDKDSTVTLLW